MPEVFDRLLAMLLTRTRCARRTVLGKDLASGKIWTVDDVESTGLVRFDEAEEIVDAPFVFLRFVTSRRLPNIRVPTCYADFYAQPTPTWQHWEDFCIAFRRLKTHALDGTTVSWRDLHAGAILSREFAASTS